MNVSAAPIRRTLLMIQFKVNDYCISFGSTAIETPRYISREPEQLEMGNDAYINTSPQSGHALASVENSVPQAGQRAVGFSGS